MPDLALPRRWNVSPPANLHGQWAELYADTVNALLDRYAARGPQYEMLVTLAAGLYVQTKRMEATGAIRGLDSLDTLIARQLAITPEVGIDEAAYEAQKQLASASDAIRTYLNAIETLRKLIEQAQRYSEARRQEIVVSEVNLAVVEVLRIVETIVDSPPLFSRIVLAVRAALEGRKAA